MINRIFILCSLYILLFFGCTSHPPVFPQFPREGETNMGFAFSMENIIPVMWWRYPLNKYTDIGLKLGIPISGTGVDISRILMKKERRWDVLNLAYSISPNSSIDLTYYMFNINKKEKLSFDKPPLKTRWKAFRCMIIPNGIYKSNGDDKSIRFGFLFGRRFGEKWGFETGYFHDFKGGWNSTEKYPHKDKRYKMPTQFSKGLGFSMQLFLYLPDLKSK